MRAPMITSITNSQAYRPMPLFAGRLLGLRSVLRADDFGSRGRVPLPLVPEWLAEPLGYWFEFCEV